MKIKEKLMQKVLMGLLCSAFLGMTFVSCTDYQDDIDDLQEQVSANTEELARQTRQLKALSDAFKEGVIITSVTSDGNGGVIVNTAKVNADGTITPDASYHVEKGAKGEPGQSIQGPEGPIGPRGYVPTFTIDGNGNLIATWPEESGYESENLGQVAPEVPEVSFSIDDEGNLIYNDQNLGNVIGPKARMARRRWSTPCRLFRLPWPTECFLSRLTAKRRSLAM